MRWRAESVRALLVGAALLGAGTPGFGQSYPWKPVKPITIIVPWGAGGATDQVTRVTAGILEDELKQRVVVVNQPGASGAIGTKNAWEAPRDGYTWAAGAPKQLGTYKLLGQWDTWIDDWHLYNTVTNVPMVSVNPNTPYKTMGDFLAAMKAGTVTIATAGVGSSGHSAAEALKTLTGGNYRHVTYDGGNPAVVATVAGEAQATTQLASEQAEMVRGKRLRPLAVLSDQPLEIEGHGKIPPVTEFVSGKVPMLSTTFGIFLPKQGTPPEVIETLNRIWETKIPNHPKLRRYAVERGAQFTPGFGQAARERVWPEIQADAWAFHAAGRTTISPEALKIPRP
jgi:tripartite-type tricarboxylate transporter receptor subunit TctC